MKMTTGKKPILLIFIIFLSVTHTPQVKGLNSEEWINANKNTSGVEETIRELMNLSLKDLQRLCVKENLDYKRWKTKQPYIILILVEHQNYTAPIPTDYDMDGVPNIRDMDPYNALDTRVLINPNTSSLTEKTYQFIEKQKPWVITFTALTFLLLSIKV